MDALQQMWQRSVESCIIDAHQACISMLPFDMWRVNVKKQGEDAFIAYRLQDVRLPGGHVDVNLHPTKKEVGFLHQEELIEAICSAIEERLTKSDEQYAPFPVLIRLRMAIA